MERVNRSSCKIPRATSMTLFYRSRLRNKSDSRVTDVFPYTIRCSAFVAFSPSPKDHEFSDIQFLFNKRIIYIYIYIWWDSWTLGVVSKCQVSIVRVLQAKENSLVMIEEAVNLLEISLCSTKELRLLLFFESTGTGVIYLTMSNDLLITCFRTKAFLLLSRTWKKIPFIRETNE